MGVPSTWNLAWSRSRASLRTLDLAYYVPDGTTQTDAENAVPEGTVAPGDGGIGARRLDEIYVRPNATRDNKTLVVFHYEWPRFYPRGTGQLFARTGRDKRLVRVLPGRDLAEETGVHTDGAIKYGGVWHNHRWRTVRGDPYEPIGTTHFALRFTKSVGFVQSLVPLRNTINSTSVHGFPAKTLLAQGLSMDHRHIVGAKDQTIYEFEFDLCPVGTWDTYTEVQRYGMEVQKAQVADTSGDDIDNRFQNVSMWKEDGDPYAVNKWDGREVSWTAISSIQLID